MSHRRIGYITLFVLALLVVLAAPVAAQGDNPGKLVVGGQYTLRSGQQLEGDLGVVGGQATIEEGATVNGDVMVAGGTLRVAGRIEGAIAVFGGSVTLEPTAYVAGDLVTFGGSVERSPGAVVDGDMREGGTFDAPGWPGTLLLPGMDRFTAAPEVSFQQTPGQWLLLILMRAIRAGVMILALAALALVATLLWPKGIERLGQTVIQQPVLIFLVGLLGWVVGVGLVVFLAVTICLIPIALLLGLVLLVVALLSWVVAGWLVGRKLLAVLNLRNATVVVEAAVGTLLLATVYFLVGIIPCTEFIFGVLIASLGLGAIVLTRFGTRPYPMAPVTGETGAQVESLAVVPAGDEPQPPQLTRQ
jgi:cytoskeletal protein CcmA (bactofilin family)